MALNFPTDTSQPYFDPVSGLKYIYNTSIGAWESAVQPPAVVFPTAPVIDIPGFLWWDETEGRLKVWYVSNGSGAWVDATPVPQQITTNSPVAPSNPNDGDLWWDTENGRLYVYYEDADSSQWVDASPNPDNRATSTTAIISQGTQPPGDPNPNDMWFNSDVGQLFIYYEDADSSQWVVTQNLRNPDAVETISVTGALTVTGTAKNPIISLTSATDSSLGITRHATVAESNAGTASDVALTPSVLKATISSYVTNTVDYATTAEATAGTLTNKAITPAALAAALPSLGTANPTGTVLEFANQNPPSGYLKCDGSAVSRTTYSTLFGVIGTTFGAGNTKTTFNLPNLTHTNPLLIYCIKQ